MTRKILLPLFVLFPFAGACSKPSTEEAKPVAVAEEEEEEEDTSDEITYSSIAALTSGTLVLNYATTALTSASAAAASLRLLEEGADANIPYCSENGSPWDVETSARMQIDNALYPETAFKCQLQIRNSPETVLGAFSLNSAVICALENGVGAELEYSEAGTTYEDVAVIPTAACGFSADQMEDVPEGGFPGRIIATSYASGPWTKSLDLYAEAAVNMKIFMNVTNESIDFKFIETWSQQARIDDYGADGDNVNQNIAEDRTGVSGGVISIDLVNGILRAETGDSYWGRRSRLLASGTFDPETGTFTEISAMEGAVSNFDLSTNNGQASLYAETATVKGTKEAGLAYLASRLSCSGTCDPSVDVLASTVEASELVCSVEGGCTDNAGIVIDNSAASFAFLSVGAVWDSQEGVSADFDAWMTDAAPLTFTTVTLDSILE